MLAPFGSLPFLPPPPQSTPHSSTTGIVSEAKVGSNLARVLWRCCDTAQRAKESGEGPDQRVVGSSKTRLERMYDATIYRRGSRVAITAKCGCFRIIRERPQTNVKFKGHSSLLKLHISETIKTKHVIGLPVVHIKTPLKVPKENQVEFKPKVGQERETFAHP
ncbi:hypothetical protein J6590_004236 [Homalodisca vitripennis]|nr:hypothetical protein J6590_004236 [Homalodisca vitripennis]